MQIYLGDDLVDIDYDYETIPGYAAEWDEPGDPGGIEEIRIRIFDEELGRYGPWIDPEIEFSAEVADEIVKAITEDVVRYG